MDQATALVLLRSGQMTESRYIELREERGWTMSERGKTVKITAQCVGCKSKREIDHAESRKLSLQRSVPMCEKCGMPMVAVLAKVRRVAIAKTEGRS